MSTEGFTQADFDPRRAANGGIAFQTGQVWSNPVALSGAVKGGSGGRQTQAQSSAATSALMRQGSAQLTRQFVAGGRSGQFTGTRGYRGFTAGASLARAVNATVANARKASADLTRQNIARQTSNVATGGKNYRITKTPQSLQQAVNRTLANARKASVDLTRQNRARQTSNVATGGRRYAVKATPQSLRQAVHGTLGAARRVDPQNNQLLRNRQAANRFSGTPGAQPKATARGYTPRPSERQSEQARQARRLLGRIKTLTRLHPESAARWNQAKQWAETNLEALRAALAA